MKKLKTFNEFIFESFATRKQKYSGANAKKLGIKRGKWVKIDPRKHPQLADEFFDLISVAYSTIGGHVKVQKPDDVFSDPDWAYWEGVDLHDSPDLDLIIWGQNTKYGIKFSGVGHDGKKDSKRAYLKHKVKDLRMVGFYGEVSGKLAAILLNKYKLHHVMDEEKVKKILNGKNIIWHGKHPTDPNMGGEGWYSRKLGGKLHPKIIIGNPTV
jgi:hypothetical protein